MIKKIIENTVFVFLLFVLAIAISPVLPFKNLPRTYTVVSGSMEPSIKTGSIVLTQPVSPSSLRVGDVVAFTSPSNSRDVILHRITGIKSTDPLRFETKGDNNDTADPWDLMDVGVLGRQILSIPYLGHITAFIRTPLGFALLIIVPAVLFIISQVLNIRKYIKLEIERQVSSKTLPILFLFVSFLTTSSMLFTTSILANFYSTASVSGVTFSVKDFVAPPAPQLVTPLNNAYRNTTGLVMDWSDVLDYQNQHNPVYYIYQSSRNLSFSPLAYQSGRLTSSQIPAPGTPAGIYYWRVKACDSIDNCSAWSDVWKITIDNSPVLPPQNLHWNNPDISCGGYSNSFTATADWDDVVGATSYTYEIDYPPLSGGRAKWRTNLSNSQYTGTFHQAEGLHFYRVMATNGVGQTSAWSPACSVTYDKTAPSSSVDADQSDIQNSYFFNIHYTATDTNLDYVQLCYSHNLGSYVCGYQQSSPAGSFAFDSPNGDGLYNFYTIARDLAGNIESIKPSELVVQVDTKAPTTNVDLNSITVNHTSGQNILENGSFEQGMVGWSIESVGGDHHIVSSGEDTFGDTFNSLSGNNMFIIGDKDSQVDTTFDRIFQEISLPSNLSSSLNFSYRVVSFDTVDNDYFSVDVASSSGEIVENILTTGSNEIGGSSFTGDSDWVSLAHSLLRYAGQTIKILFTQYNSNPGDNLRSWTYLDDIKVNTLDLRLGETSPLDFNTHDSGSGILLPQGPSDLVVGENVVQYQNDDIAVNVEPTESITAVVLPSVVINKIDSSGFIELYNNTSGDVDISGYKVNNLAVGSTVLPSHQSIQISIGYTETYILNDGVSDVDISPQVAVGDIWQRAPVGIGTWSKSGHGLDFNLVTRPSVNKITLSIFNLLNSVDYEIIYSNNIGQQGVSGTISPSTIVAGKSDRDFYLGTCSSGACLADTVSIGSTISVTVDGVTKYFNY